MLFLDIFRVAPRLNCYLPDPYYMFLRSIKCVTTAIGRNAEVDFVFFPCPRVFSQPCCDNPSPGPSVERRSSLHADMGSFAVRPRRRPSHPPFSLVRSVGVEETGFGRSDFLQSSGPSEHPWRISCLQLDWYGRFSE